ncbi:hypothetical protein EV421DRAFT_100651 [Armillaria borealis]|uniref:Uncharacterized protein n=1 Tax=Armillaria borealis TaxID=47425 RepID=A0AA39N3K9_9AGAR|nr:hypothetical protein EV421DRAFT_100651 [Armillaria borealis]
MTLDAPSSGLLLIIALSTALWLFSTLSKLPLPPGPPRHWLFGSGISTKTSSSNQIWWIRKSGVRLDYFLIDYRASTSEGTEELISRAIWLLGQQTRWNVPTFGPWKSTN